MQVRSTEVPTSRVSTSTTMGRARHEPASRHRTQWPARGTRRCSFPLSATCQRMRRCDHRCAGRRTGSPRGTRPPAPSAFVQDFWRRLLRRVQYRWSRPVARRARVQSSAMRVRIRPGRTHRHVALALPARDVAATHSVRARPHHVDGVPSRWHWLDEVVFEASSSSTWTPSVTTSGGIDAYAAGCSRACAGTGSARRPAAHAQEDPRSTRNRPLGTLRARRGNSARSPRAPAP